MAADATIADPFPEYPIRAEDFAVSVEETNPTLALAAPDIDLTVHVKFTGKGVVYQLYGRPCLQFVVECLDGCNNLAEGEFTREQRNTEGTVGDWFIRPMKLNPRPEARGTVFSDPSILPAALRERFIEGSKQMKTIWHSADPDPDPNPWRSLWEWYAEKLTFTGPSYTAKVRLSDHWLVSEGRRMRLRVGLFVYPETTSKDWTQPIKQRQIVWSSPLEILTPVKPTPTPIPSPVPLTTWGVGPADYPYPQGTAGPTDFVVSVGETSATLPLRSLKAPVPISVTVRYTGRGVLWQSHPKPSDLLFVECIDGCGVLAPGPRTVEHRVAPDSMVDEMANYGWRHYMEYEPWRAAGIVFSDPTISPQLARQGYELGLWNPETAPSIPEPSEKIIRSLRAEALQWLGMFNFTGDRYSTTLNLSDDWLPKMVGKCRVRVGLRVYPEATWKNTLTQRSSAVTYWSEPIAVEVK